MSICFFWNKCKSIVLVCFEFRFLLLSPSISLSFMEIRVSYIQHITVCPYSQSGRLLGVPDSEWIRIKYQYMLLCGSLLRRNPSYQNILFFLDTESLTEEGRKISSFLIFQSFLLLRPISLSSSGGSVQLFVVGFNSPLPFALYLLRFLQVFPLSCLFLSSQFLLLGFLKYFSTFSL